MKKFVIWEGDDGRHWWTYVAGNKKELAHSAQGYESPYHARRAAEQFFGNIKKIRGKAPIEEA